LQLSIRIPGVGIVNEKLMMHIRAAHLGMVLIPPTTAGQDFVETPGAFSLSALAESAEPMRREFLETVRALKP
jgi:hypothetical protein